jgi:hypothetical protein
MPAGSHLARRAGALTRAALRDDALAAGALAAVVSGAPSTAYALVAGRPVLEGALAAGSLLAPAARRPAVLLAAAVPVHLALSLGWAQVLARVLPATRPQAAAPLAGLAIAALDLGVIGRRFPRIRALPVAPQVADHLAYAQAVALVLARRRRRMLPVS